MTIFDLTPEMVDRIVEMTSIPESQIATKADLAALRATLRNDLLNPATAQSRKIVAGALAPEFQSGRLEYVKVDTEALAASDNLDTISTTGFADFQMLFLRLESQARQVVFRDEVVTGLGNMKLKSSTFTMNGSYAYLILMLIGPYWVEVSRSPGMGELLSTNTQTFVRSSSTVDAGALDLTGMGLCVALGQNTGETLADFEITIGAPGTSGDIDTTIDEGLGIYSIGSYSYTGSPTEATVRAAYTAVINGGTGTHGFTAVDTGSVVQVIAPTGSGASANIWTTALTAEGDSVASITTPIGGGVDGVNSADTITDITGMQYNQECRVINAMPNPTDILTFDTTGNINGNAGHTWRIKPGESLGVIADEGGNVNISWHPADPCCLCTTVTLTQAQIQALNGTPVQCIPAPASGQIISPESFFITADYNGTPYATNTDLELYFPSAGVVFYTFLGVLSATSDVYRSQLTSGDETKFYPGEALMVRSPGGNPTGNGSTFKIHISYRIITF